MSTHEKFINFSKPFIDGAKNVFKTMVFSELEHGKPQLKSNPIAKGDISAIMGLSGKLIKDGQETTFKGMFVMSFPESTYCKVASAMLMEEHSEITDDIIDVGAELTNIITGNAKKNLNPDGYFLDMSTPSTVSGKDHKVNYPSNTIVIMIPMNSSHGEFFIELCYQDG